MLQDDQGLRARSNGFGLEFGIDCDGAGQPNNGGCGAGMRFTLDIDLVATGLSLGLERVAAGSASVAVGAYVVARDAGLPTRIEERSMTASRTPPLAALDVTVDAVTCGSDNGEWFRQEQLEIGTFAHLA